MSGERRTFCGLFGKLAAIFIVLLILFVVILFLFIWHRIRLRQPPAFAPQQSESIFYETNSSSK